MEAKYKITTTMNKFKKRHWPFTILIMVLISVTTIFASCKDDDDTYNTHQVQTNNDPNIRETEAYIAFIDAIDSLNLEYSGAKTRGSFRSGFGVTLADETGRYLGGYIGRYVGGAIGSLTGTPVGTVAGCLIGQKVGPVLCNAIASGIAAKVLSDEVAQKTYDVPETKYCDVFLDITDEIIDSLGYYHNECMVMLNKKSGEYGSGSNLNLDKLYDDVVKYYKSVGIYESELETNILLKKAILEEVEKICKPAVRYEIGEISENELIDINVDYLTNEINCTDDNVAIFKDFSCKLALKCADLNEDELKEYACDVNQVILDSSVPEEVKEELILSAESIVNSSLCWE